MLGQKLSHYDILEVAPDAGPQEILESYLRLKAAYDKNSVALYSLVSKEDTEDTLRQIEEAYHTLSHPERRREYDRNYSLGKEEHRWEKPFSLKGKKVISIDRVPPMDTKTPSEDILVAPSTDFDSDAPAQKESPKESATATVRRSTPPPMPGPDRTQSVTGPALRGEVAAQIDVELENEHEWRGALLRSIRERRGISIEEMADHTRISKTYLKAIEDEDFTKLPAAVFLRGFVVQVAKKLKIPHDKVAAAYLNRFKHGKTGS